LAPCSEFRFLFAPPARSQLTWGTFHQYSEEDECEDPLFDEVDPVEVPASTPTKILLTSASLEEQITSALEQHDHHMSLQSLPVHMMLPSLPYQSFFSSDDETTWETASASSSEDESELDDVWDQFCVEWIDFDGAH